MYFTATLHSLSLSILYKLTRNMVSTDQLENRSRPELPTGGQKMLMKVVTRVAVEGNISEWVVKAQLSEPECTVGSRRHQRLFCFQWHRVIKQLSFYTCCLCRFKICNLWVVHIIFREKMLNPNNPPSTFCIVLWMVLAEGWNL